MYPHVLQRALDVIQPVAVSLYTASAYHTDAADPWGQNCAARGFKVNEDDYWSPATAYAQFDVSKRLLCMARKVEQEKNMTLFVVRSESTRLLLVRAAARGLCHDVVGR